MAVRKVGFQWVSANAVGQRRLDLGAGVQRAKHNDRVDRRACQFRAYVARDSGQTKHVNAQPFVFFPHGLKIGVRVVPYARIERLAVNDRRITSA